MSARPYAESAALVAMATAIGFIAGEVVRRANLDIIYLLIVLVIALRWGR